jgi:DNA-binding transcriptional MerR regulator
MFTIGKLASLAGCQPLTIRFYEKKGLMEKPKRQENGYRTYTDKDVERLVFIRHCRYHGFSMDEIRDLLSLRDAPEASCGTVDSILIKQINKLDEYIRSTKRLREELIELRKKCPHSTSVANCGIMKGLLDRKLCPCIDDHPGGLPGGHSFATRSLDEADDPSED